MFQKHTPTNAANHKLNKQAKQKKTVINTISDNNKEKWKHNNKKPPKYENKSNNDNNSLKNCKKLYKKTKPYKYNNVKKENTKFFKPYTDLKIKSWKRHHTHAINKNINK